MYPSLVTLARHNHEYLCRHGRPILTMSNHVTSHPREYQNKHCVYLLKCEQLTSQVRLGLREHGVVTNIARQTWLSSAE
jgi:hypothetical protein